MADLVHYSKPRPYISYVLMPTSQYNSIPLAIGRFLADCEISRSVAHRPILLTLNNVVNSPSGHLTIAAGKLFGRRPILSSNDQIFGRFPAGVPSGIGRTPGDRPRATMNPAITGRSPFGGCLVIGRIPSGVRWVQFSNRFCNFIAVP